MHDADYGGSEQCATEDEQCGLSDARTNGKRYCALAGS